jgi:hypothetical protein
MVFLSPLSLAQVAIQNPQHLAVPEQQVQTVHNIICRVVAEEFHVRQMDTLSTGELTLCYDYVRNTPDFGTTF